jgi:hypothetical protein
MSLNFEELQGVFGLVPEDGGTRVNSIIINRLFANSIYCDGLITGEGFLTINGGNNITSIQVVDGSVSAPSMSFINSVNTGIYRTGDGSIGHTVNGSNVLSLGSASAVFYTPISTPIGVPLVLTSGTGTVDFGGASLVNVGGITTNPNRYEVIAPASLITADATPSILYNIPTIVDASYTITTDITCVNATDGSASAGFNISAKGKNIGGFVSVSVNMENNSAIDMPLLGISVIHGVSGQNITVLVTGKAATTLKWFGATTVTRQQF